jgi:hypothetical protein
MKPIKFIITETEENLVSHSGLAFVGALLADTQIGKKANALCLPDKPRPETTHADVLRSMIGLVCLGKPEFSAIEAFRDDSFFAAALGLQEVPSEPTLRQRLEEFGFAPQGFLREEAARLVRRHAPSITPCFKSWVALDVDVSPFDNSHTKKEGVGLTYKKVDGYAPIFAYLGQEGYLVHEELRVGTQHCQKGTPEFLAQAIVYARLITDASLLVRMDAGNDAATTLETCHKQKVDFIIKRNLRQESTADWLVDAQALGDWREPRDGKRIYVGETSRLCGERAWRVIFEVTERTSTATGQVLIVPEVEVNTYWTSLGSRTANPDEIIELYRAHGTSEQFHSELKTDLDLERLPSGKFAVNALVLTCGLVAYNLLRLIGQIALQEDRHLPPEKRMPIRKAVKRRRLRSVIQDLMYAASRLVYHARRWRISLARRNPWRGAWTCVYTRLNANVAMNCT